MDKIEFENHYINPDGKVYEKETNKEINDLSFKRPGLFYRISGVSEDLCITIGKHLFGFEGCNCYTISFGHIDECWVNNSFDNIKIFSKSDKNNRSKNFIALYNGVVFYYENGVPKHESKNPFLELNIS